MEPRNVFWKRKFLIPGTQWTMSGYSRAAYRTGFFLTGLDIMLDAGPQSFKKPKHIFITHTHGDHVANLPFTLIKENDEVFIKETESGEYSLTLYAPMEAEAQLHNYNQALFSVNAMMDVADVKQTYNFVGVKQERSSMVIKMNGSDIKVDTVGADHSIKTVIYGFSLIKRKLDEKYKDIDKKELIAIKKSGTDITVEVVDKKLCYILDTSIKTLVDNHWLLEYPVMIIECTFLLDDELDNAVRTKHVHWMQLKPYVLANPHVTFILVHFSLRYKDQEILDFFTKECEKESIKNVVPWTTDVFTNNFEKDNTKIES